MSLGFDPAQFWDLTPREIATLMDGAADRLRREQDEHICFAWHVAALTRAKRLPKLKDIMSPKPKRRKTWEEQLAAVMAFDKRINRESSDRRTSG